MPKPVKLADDIMNAARKEAVLHGRSVADQIAHWVSLGRTIESSPNFDSRRISLALAGGLSPDELTPVEQQIWFGQFAEMMVVPKKQEKAFHANRRRLGRGVGMSSSGEIVYEKHEG